MSNTNTTSDTSTTEPSTRVLKPGELLYDADGAEVGTVRAITEYGVEVRTRGGVETASLKQALRGDSGEGYLLWRCATCGELGDLEQIPDRCPGCDAPREELYAYLED
ncbi:DUF7130 family rubredoxin-like protein [Halobellus captivus]|uniref:DUF7130 family rubredoxin-like protein n=1 Tax=Halobellus captivus TaxID=2592614 RepID=UPI001EF12DE5|nr:hypothetical protein [Halobellus captivus]